MEVKEVKMRWRKIRSEGGGGEDEVEVKMRWRKIRSEGGGGKGGGEEVAGVREVLSIWGHQRV